MTPEYTDEKGRVWILQGYNWIQRDKDYSGANPWPNKGPFDGLRTPGSRRTRTRKVAAMRRPADARRSRQAAALRRKSVERVQAEAVDRAKFRRFMGMRG